MREPNKVLVMKAVGVATFITVFMITTVVLHREFGKFEREVWLESSTGMIQAQFIPNPEGRCKEVEGKDYVPFRMTSTKITYRCPMNNIMPFVTTYSSKDAPNLPNAVPTKTVKTNYEPLSGILGNVVRELTHSGQLK